MNTRITSAAAQKLRSGHTVWRCQTGRDGNVYIHEFMLRGSKYTRVMRSMFPENVPERKRKVLSTSVKIGDKSEWLSGEYLSSINPGSSINTFSTRRAAERWKREVEAGLHPEHVAKANEHWDWCDSLSYGTDFYYDDGQDDDDYHNGLEDQDSAAYDRVDAFEDYTGPDNPQAAYTKPTALGELLRQKLAQIDAEKAAGA